MAYKPPCTTNSDTCRQRRIVAAETAIGALQDTAAALQASVDALTARVTALETVPEPPPPPEPDPEPEPEPEPPPPTPEPPPPSATLVIDDFTGTALNPDLWCAQYWWEGVEYGLGERGEINLPEQISLHDSQLDIHAHRQVTPNPNYPGDRSQDRPYRSGVVTTGSTKREGGVARLSWLYGLLEVRAKFPPGLGYRYGYWTAAQSKMWPAIWMLAADGNVNDTDRPEIDLVDLFGDTTYVQMSLQNGKLVPGPYGGQWKPERVSSPGSVLRYSGAEHWDATWSGPPWPPRVETGDAWHTWGLNWTPDKVEFLLDGVVHATETTRVPRVPYYLLINLAVGHRSGFWPPGPETPDDHHLLVDWVRLTRHPETRVYRRGVLQP